jgi:hypothetical protein
MIKISVLILCLLPIPCNALFQSPSTLSPAELLPADVATLIFCNFLRPSICKTQEELEVAKKRSVQAIITLKTALQVCRAWHKAGNSGPVIKHFLTHLAYDPTCAVYTSEPKSKDFFFGMHGNPAAVITKSINPHLNDAVLTYFLNHPTNDPLHNEIKAKIRAEGKVPFRNYEEMHHAYTYFENVINRSYLPLYAALNLNTAASRAMIAEHLTQRPHQMSHILILACLYGKNLLVQALLKNGANPNISSSERTAPRPLHIAVAYNQCDVVQSLLACPRLKTDELDWNQETPLAKALHLANPKMIRILMDHERVDVQNVPASSCRLPSIFRNESNNAAWYASQFCPDIDRETRAYIDQKVDERYRKSDA